MIKEKKEENSVCSPHHPTVFDTLATFSFRIFAFARESFSIFLCLWNYLTRERSTEIPLRALCYRRSTPESARNHDDTVPRQDHTQQNGVHRLFFLFLLFILFSCCIITLGWMITPPPVQWTDKIWPTDSSFRCCAITYTAIFFPLFSSLPLISERRLCHQTHCADERDNSDMMTHANIQKNIRAKKMSTTSEKKRRNKNQRTWLLRLNFHPIYTSNEKNRRPYKGEWYYINITIIRYWCAICGQHSVGGHLIMIVITAYIHASWDSVLFIYRLAPKLGLEMIERISAVVTSS